MVFYTPPKRKNDQRVEIRPHHLTILSIVFLISAGTIASLWWNASRPTPDYPTARLMFWQRYEGMTLDLRTGEMEVVQGGPLENDNPWLKMSPDGKWAARWSSDNECCQWSLHIYEGVDGPNRGFITRFGGGDMVSWSDNSQWIAFSAYPEGTLHDPNDPSQKELYLANVYTHEVKQLTDNEVMDSGPSFSPDGTKIAYTSSAYGRNYLHIMDLKTGETRLLTSEIQGYNPAWSPDGQWIAFVTKCGSRDPMRATRGALWIIRPDGTDAQKIQQRVNFIEPRWLS